MIQISEVQITPIRPKDGHVGFASCVINNGVFLGSIGIHTSLKRPGGFRITYPTKNIEGPNGMKRKIDFYRPISREAGKLIENAIISEYERLMKC